MRKGKILLWTKQDIATILGIEYYVLKRHIPEKIKKEIGWKAGVQYFRDIEVFAILKYYRGLLTDAELRELVYPMSFQAPKPRNT
jgi:hypothetical protein